jgi:hypothetical protein
MPLLAYDDFVKARANLWANQGNYKPNINVVINDEIVFNLSSPTIGVMSPGLVVYEPYVVLGMSHGLLQKIIGNTLSYAEGLEHIKVKWGVSLRRGELGTYQDFHDAMGHFHV